MITKGYGCIPDKSDPRDHRFMVARPVPLPAAVDLRKWYPPIMDQGELGACIMHGTSGVLRWHIIKAGGKPDAPLSRLQGYYDLRAIEHSINEDAGGQIRNGIKVARDIGLVYENLWPYDIAKFKQKPPAELYAKTQLFGSLKFERVPITVAGLKTALAGGFPVVIGVTLYERFESDAVAKNGIVPLPDTQAEGMAGDHCMTCLGYEHGNFIVANSWGTDWGDKGYCYMPEKYLGSSEFGSDYWVIRNVVPS